MPAAAFASDIFGEASFGGGSARSAGGGADSGLDDDDIFGLGAATSATEPSYSSRGAMADGLDDDDDIFGLGATSAPPPPPPPPAASASAFDDLLAGVTEKPDANGPRAYDDFADAVQPEQPLPQPQPPPPPAAASVYEAVETQEPSVIEDLDGSDIRGVLGESRSWRRYAEDEWITVDDYVFHTSPSGPPPRRPPPAIVVEKKKQASRAPPPPPSQKPDQKLAGSRSSAKSEPKTTPRSRSEPTREKRMEEADAAAAQQQQQQRKDESSRGAPPSSAPTSEQEADADLKRSESAAQAVAAAASAAASAAAMKEAMERAQRKAEAAREARERERLREKARERERERERDKELEKERQLQRQREREQEQEAQAAAKREREQAAARANDGGFADFFNMPPPPQPSRPSSEPRQRPPQPEPATSRGPTNLDDLGSVPKPSQPAGVKKSPSAGSVDDWTNILGGSAAASDVFQEVEGEPPERRKARMEKHQRMQDRLAAAINEKNQRDLDQVREQAERQRAGDLLDAEIKRWAAGKEGNLRALLSTLQYVLWPECNWTPVSLTDVIEGASVKKVYRRATLVVHPDKVQQKGATIQQKYIAEKVFDLLKEAWNKFNSEELF
eukprot:SM000306S11746  [mRNA]  locus=s306:6305:9634:- [translate_table: standard]